MPTPLRIVLWGAYGLMLLALVVLFFRITTPAGAEDRGAWFKSLKQPLTGASCCDISDCHLTQSEWKGGAWHAVVAGKWREIPDEVVLKKKVSILEDAVVCNAAEFQAIPGMGSSVKVEEPRIYCFVPPNMGF